jgi:hexosaminidase
VPDRTVDMSYLIDRELLLPFGEWYDKVETARNDYARSHGVPERHDSLQWSDYTHTH